MLSGCVSGRPRSVCGAASLCLSLVAEGTVVCPREPWIVACEHARQSPVLIRPPRNTRPANQFEPADPGPPEKVGSSPDRVGLAVSLPGVRGVGQLGS